MTTTTLAALQSIIVQGESKMLELKRSTAELTRLRDALRLLDGDGGKVLIGSDPTAGWSARRSLTSRSATTRRCSGVSCRPPASR